MEHQPDTQPDDGGRSGDGRRRGRRSSSRPAASTSAFSLQLPECGIPNPRALPPDPATAASEVLRTQGIEAALRYLNARTRCRYTGIYRVDPPVLRNIRLFDRENPTLNVSGGVSSTDMGYCGIACATMMPFSASNARRDPRLTVHRARNSMLCYAGAPIRTTAGRGWGTVCHFDSRPRIVPDRELAILKAVTPPFMDWLRAHGHLA